MDTACCQIAPICTLMATPTRSNSSQRLQPGNWSIRSLPGLSEADQEKLLHIGIQTTRQLLVKTKTPQARQAIAAALEIHIQYVNKWVALADLARIPTVGCQYCGLLLHAGISSPAQLGQMPLAKVHQQIMKLQIAMMQRQDLCPELGEISLWQQQAKAIAPF